MSQPGKVMFLHTDLLSEDYCINYVYKNLIYFLNSFKTQSTNKQIMGRDCLSK